jgi:hypothetical protein
MSLFSLKKSGYLTEFSADSVPKFPICKCERPRISVNVPPASLPSYFTLLRYGGGGMHECVGLCEQTDARELSGLSLLPLLLFLTITHNISSVFSKECFKLGRKYNVSSSMSVLNWEEIQRVVFHECFKLGSKYNVSSSMSVLNWEENTTCRLP